MYSRCQYKFTISLRFCVKFKMLVQSRKAFLVNTEEFYLSRAGVQTIIDIRDTLIGFCFYN